MERGLATRAHGAYVVNGILLGGCEPDLLGAGDERKKSR
jgi:hypothetical protein